MSHADPSGAITDAASLTVTFRHPPDAFLYRATNPRMLIDGVEHPVPGWGTCDVAVPSGTHRVTIWVPYVFPRRAGRAQADVVVTAGEPVPLEYMAPALTFAKGSLGTPGAQRSTGLSTIRIVNIVTVAFAAVVLLAVLVTR